MSKAKMGKKVSSKTKELMSAASKDKPKSEEHKENIRIARLAAPLRSQETKDKISKRKTGIKWVKKDNQSKTIYPHEFAEYLKNGWVFGRILRKENK
jgi:hypothetical protein